MFILLNISKFVMKQLISNQRVSCLYHSGGRVKKTAFFVLWDFISIFLSLVLLYCLFSLVLRVCVLGEGWWVCLWERKTDKKGKQQKTEETSREREPSEEAHSLLVRQTLKIITYNPQLPKQVPTSHCKGSTSNQITEESLGKDIIS